MICFSGVEEIIGGMSGNLAGSIGKRKRSLLDFDIKLGKCEDTARKENVSNERVSRPRELLRTGEHFR